MWQQLRREQPGLVPPRALAGIASLERMLLEFPASNPQVRIEQLEEALLCVVTSSSRVGQDGTTSRNVSVRIIIVSHAWVRTSRDCDSSPMAP